MDGRGNESLVEVFEKEVKKVEGLGLAGVGEKRVEDGKGMDGKGRGGVVEMQNGVLTVQAKSSPKEDSNCSQAEMERKSRRVGRSQGALVPFITLE